MNKQTWPGGQVLKGTENSMRSTQGKRLRRA